MFVAPPLRLTVASPPAMGDPSRAHNGVPMTKHPRLSSRGLSRRLAGLPWLAVLATVLALATRASTFGRAVRVDAPSSLLPEAVLRQASNYVSGDDEDVTREGAVGTPVCDSCRARGAAAPSLASLAALEPAPPAEHAFGRRLTGGYDVVFALSDSLNDGDTTSLVSVTLTIGFATGSVTGFEASDFVVQGCTITSLSGGGNIYTAVLSLFGRDVTVLLPAGSVEPSPSNEANQVTLTYGTASRARGAARPCALTRASSCNPTVPKVTLTASHGLSSGSSTSLDVFTLTAMFHTAVTGVAISDFGVSGASVDVFTAVSPLVYATARACCKRAQQWY